MTWVMFHVGFKLWSSSRIFLQPPVTSLLGLKMLLSTLFWNTFNLLKLKLCHHSMLNIMSFIYILIWFLLYIISLYGMGETRAKLIISILGSIYQSAFFCGGTRWRSWSRHCATSRNVADSIPNGVIGIFHWHNPSGCTTALGSTQPLTEMSTRNISWGVKAAGA
jgi:hypothetical protein